MTDTLAELKQKAAQLSEPERAELALALIESLDGQAESDVEEAWRVEVERRVAQIERGEVQLIPGDEVFARLRRRLGLYPYSFHPDADTEFEEASILYESLMAGLGRAFAAEVERTISLIREFPDAGAEIGRARRRVLTARFPYAIIYRRDPDAIVIVAVAHQRRRPDYWRSRR